MYCLNYHLLRWSLMKNLRLHRRAAVYRFSRRTARRWRRTRGSAGSKTLQWSGRSFRQLGKLNGRVIRVGKVKFEKICPMYECWLWNFHEASPCQCSTCRITLHCSAQALRNAEEPRAVRPGALRFPRRAPEPRHPRHLDRIDHRVESTLGLYVTL